MTRFYPPTYETFKSNSNHQSWHEAPLPADLVMGFSYLEWAQLCISNPYWKIWRKFKKRLSCMKKGSFFGNRLCYCWFSFFFHYFFSNVLILIKAQFKFILPTKASNQEFGKINLFVFSYKSHVLSTIISFCSICILLCHKHTRVYFRFLNYAMKQP